MPSFGRSGSSGWVGLKIRMSTKSLVEDVNTKVDVGSLAGSGSCGAVSGVGGSRGVRFTYPSN